MFQDSDEFHLIEEGGPVLSSLADNFSIVGIWGLVGANWKDGIVVVGKEVVVRVGLDAILHKGDL